MDNRFVILVGSYNNEKWVSQNIESVLKQTHKNFRLVYYNAASTDKTYEIAKSYADRDNRINLQSTAVRNLKTWFFHNLPFFETVYDNDIVCVLDGDDFLSSEDVLHYLNEVYNQTNCWMTYGGMLCWLGGDKTQEAFPQNSIPPQVVFDQKLYRKDLWRYSHMRTCRGFLWNRIPAENFTSDHDGNFFTLDDLCTVYSMLEMCPAHKIFRVDQPIYIWNASESRGCAENKENNIGQIYEAEIRNRPQSKELTIVNPVLAGGLGNQMFEVAAAASLAADNNALLVINPTEHILPNQGRNINTYVNNVFSKIAIDKNPPTKDHIDVETIYYKPFDFKPNAKLRGHFQSYKYFDKHKEYIKWLFYPPPAVVKHLEDNYHLEEAAKVTAIQVRRGDYVKFPNHHPLLPAEYYAKAVKMAGNGPVWIFSDDIPWCQENLNFGDETRYVKDEDYIEMYLMGRCKNIVISNSSFGWWAAYLSDDAKVFAPNPWFGPALIKDGFKIEDLIPPEWTLIQL